MTAAILARPAAPESPGKKYTMKIIGASAILQSVILSAVRITPVCSASLFLSSGGTAFYGWQNGSREEQRSSPWNHNPEVKKRGCRISWTAPLKLFLTTVF
jgi:hypothetical protein